MINANLGVTLRQEVEAQASELELESNQNQAAKVIVIGKFEELIDKRQSKGDTITADYYDDIYNFDKEYPYGNSKKDNIWSKDNNNNYNFYEGVHIKNYSYGRNLVE